MKKLSLNKFYQAKTLTEPVQHLICEAARTKDGVQYPLKTTDQPLPDATLVWRTGRIGPPLNALMCKFGGNVKRIPFFVTE